MNRTGFTLIEIIVILIILGITLACFFPSFTSSTQQAYSQAAKNNLLAIYSAEVNYFNNNNGAYCLSTLPSSPACAVSPNCANNLAAINCNLNLNISDSVYTYSCSNVSGFSCTANNNASSPTVWTVINAPVVLTGGGLNPSCNGGPYCSS
jgi:type II secretory pathway pseudopilin PulG